MSVFSSLCFSIAEFVGAYSWYVESSSRLRSRPLAPASVSNMPSHERLDSFSFPMDRTLLQRWLVNPVDRA